MASDSGLIGVALVGAAVVVVVALLQRAGGGAQAVVPTGSPGPNASTGPSLSEALEKQTGDTIIEFSPESSTAGQSAATDSGGGGNAGGGGGGGGGGSTGGGGGGGGGGSTGGGGGGGGGAGEPETITQNGIEVVPNSVAGITNPVDVVRPLARSMESGREPYKERGPGAPGQIV
jgi:hypothetical protein